MSKDNPFRKAIASRQQTEASEPESILDIESASLPVTQPPISLESKKRGRPATGKRSDDA